MDHLECMAVASALHDGEEVDETTSASYSEHVATCPECAAFVEGLIAVSAIDAPAPPEGAVDRVLAAIAAAPPEPGSVEAPETLPGPSAAAPALRLAFRSAPAWLTPVRLWTTAGAIGLSAAAVIVAVVVSQQAAGRSAEERAVSEAVKAALSEAPHAGSAIAGLAAPPAADTSVAKAPSYVAFAGAVYRAGQMAQVELSELTTAGIVTTALDQTGDAVGLNAYRWSRDKRTLVVALPSGGLQAFDAVVRQVGGRAYQLQTGTAIPRFGDWPRLAAGMSEPTAADGSPMFHAAGTDDLGVPVFVRVGDSVAQGVAVPPGTAPTDPAAGNPWWTWWAPLP